MKQILLYIFLILILTAPSSFARNFKIFMVQSYSSRDLCGRPQLIGAIDTLKKAGFDDKNTTIYTFFMETKTINTTKSEIEKIVLKATKEIIKENPDIIMLFDDAAFMQLAPKLINKPYKIVFSGLNKSLYAYNTQLHFMDKNRNPTANITGIYEKLHIYDGMKFIENIIKKKGKIAMLSSDDVIGKIITAQISSELKNTPYQNVLEIFHINSVNQLITALKQINNDKNIIAYILNTQSITAKDNKKINMFDSIKMAIQYAKKPDIAINSLFCKNGLFGGVSVNFSAMGAQAATQAIKLLKGVPIKNIKIEDAEKADRVINVERAKLLNIKIPISILNTLDAVY
jgi:ABC-type uncharacterized transport system substrate-binding protein